MNDNYTIPAPEGGVVVATPPHAAGKRGRTASHDWDAVVEWVRHPWNRGKMVRYSDIPANVLTRLRERYPDVQFLGHDHHVQVMRMSETKRDVHMETRPVCDVYVVCPKEEG